MSPRSATSTTSSLLPGPSHQNSSDLMRSDASPPAFSSASCASTSVGTLTRRAHSSPPAPATDANPGASSSAPAGCLRFARRHPMKPKSGAA